MKTIKIFFICIALLLLGFFAMLFASCSSTPAATIEPLALVEFPVFPNPIGRVSFDDATNTVLVPLDFWGDILEYKLQVDALKAKIQLVISDGDK